MESTCLTKIFKWGAISVGVLLLLSVVFPVFDDLPLKLVLHLVGGGFLHAWASFPHMIPDAPKLVGFAVLLTACVCALQLLLAKFAKSKEGAELRWRPKWTFAAVGLVLASIGTACATVGLAHHATWLFRDGVVYLDGGGSPVSKSISNCRQLITALRIYSSDHGGEYPKHLEDLVKEGILDQESLVRINRMIGRDGLPAPWVLLQGLTDAGPGDIPLVIGSCPVSRDMYIVGRNDSGVSTVNRQEFDEAMTRYRRFVGIEGEGQDKAEPSPQ